LNKKKLTVYFADFWPNFRPNDNYFFHLLSKKYDIQISKNNPDVLFYSVDYANKEEHKNFDNGYTKKIFFSGENTFNNSNFSLSLTCKEDTDKNIRLPLWVLFINWFENKNNQDRDPSFLIPKSSLIKSKKIKSDFSPLFCSFIASKPAGLRVDFVPNLNDFQRTHNLGRLYNNSFYRIKGRGDQKHKLKIMKLFKFNIAFENKVSDGYVSEKLLHSFYSKTVPVYWGTKKAKEDFNPDSFLFYDDFENDPHLFNEMKLISESKKKRIEILNQEVFDNNRFPDFCLPDTVLNKISEVIDT